MTWWLYDWSIGWWAARLTGRLDVYDWCMSLSDWLCLIGYTSAQRIVCMFLLICCQPVDAIALRGSRFNVGTTYGSPGATRDSRVSSVQRVKAAWTSEKRVTAVATSGFWQRPSWTCANFAVTTWGCDHSSLRGLYLSHIRAGAVGSSYSAKAVALRLALTHLVERLQVRAPAAERIAVACCTDSLSVLQRQKGYPGPEDSICTGRIRVLLRELSELAETHLVWVPGHAGVAGNEAVDALAKVAAMLPQGVAPIPFACAKARIRSTTTSTWKSNVRRDWHFRVMAGTCPKVPPILDPPGSSYCGLSSEGSLHTSGGLSEADWAPVSRRKMPALHVETNRRTPSTFFEVCELDGSSTDLSRTYSDWLDVQHTIWLCWYFCARSPTSRDRRIPAWASGGAERNLQEEEGSR
jgi:hypothetical protein